MKTKKTLLKRIKVTRTGKILKRPPHQNHFNAKDSGNAKRAKRGFKHAHKSMKRHVKALI